MIPSKFYALNCRTKKAVIKKAIASNIVKKNYDEKIISEKNLISKFEGLVKKQL